MDWPGKREAIALANTSISKTLRPDIEASKNFFKTQNLFIEGDNLEVLKLIQETYLGRIKMIYIDPPYNTGKDFIYRDNFKQGLSEYEEKSGQSDEDGTRLVSNTEASGRFHSDWLSMMLPRLKLARNLLTNNGVIFISVDDGEVANLRRLCDEIFGAECFIAQLLWKKRTGSNDAQNNVSIDHDYIICYGKIEASFNGVQKNFSSYRNPDDDPRGPWAKDNLTCNKTASERPNLFYPITDPKTGIIYECNPNRVWVYEKNRMQKIIDEGKVLFPASGKGTPVYKRHKSEVRSNTKPFSSIIETEMNFVATKRLRELMGGHYFDYPKGMHLISQIIGQGTSKDSIVLDFFAGSATTAHAVMQLNANDGGNRRFIMVQLPEPCNEKSEAAKAGYETIADISKDRIRRAGEELLQDENNSAWVRDVGFRVLRVDTSNMKDVYYKPEETNQQSLSNLADNIKHGRTDEDLLFQVLTDWGIDLSLSIRKKTIQGKIVFFVDRNVLIACFESDINEKLVKELANYKPERAVFRNGGFASDTAKINAEQIFKQLSPQTDIRAI